MSYAEDEPGMVPMMPVRGGAAVKGPLWARGPFKNVVVEARDNDDVREERDAAVYAA